jgi:glutathione peroxidase
MVKCMILAVGLTSCMFNNESSATQQTIKSVNMDTSKSIHSFQVESLEGGTINLSDFKGKKILIVNTASECGYTPQYKELQQLYDAYREKLVVIGFPCNDFGQQEPGDNAAIKSFCTKNYGVTFPLAAKTTVKGSSIAPIYAFLTRKVNNGVMDAEINWNFNKFLLDENGLLLQKFGSSVKPMSQEITSLLQ